MEKKAIYSLVEGSNIENVETVVGALKELFKTGDDNEAKVRKLEAEAERYKDIDIAKLKSDSETLEKLGGAEAIQGFKAKAEGYEEDKAKMEALNKELEDVRNKHQQDSENFQKTLDRKTLENEALPIFSEAFNSSGVLLNDALNRGLIAKGDTGLCFVDGDSKIPFSSGGLDKLKEYPDYAPSVKVPSGGNERGGVNSGGNTGNKTGGSLRDAFAGK